MAEKTAQELKVTFSTGKKPTGADYANLIDSTFNAPVEVKQVLASSTDVELSYERKPCAAVYPVRSAAGFCTQGAGRIH